MYVCKSYKRITKSFNLDKKKYNLDAPLPKERQLFSKSYIPRSKSKNVLNTFYNAIKSKQN